MKKLTIFFIFAAIFFTFSNTVYAVSDPLSTPNNFFGIHILFPSELNQAKDVVDTNGGDWGYVTIPIQITDLDLSKWQDFMDNAKRLHLIPIIRIATQPDPHNTAVWRKPNHADVLDFANFLSSLSWPTKNKYVILFNEVNRSDEWGGDPPDPSAYADIVSYAHTVFKERDPNFYLILAGMDAAAPTDYKNYISGFKYLTYLVNNTDVVSKIDGFSSHSYPNPGFTAPPLDFKKVGVATYRYEYDLINANSPRQIPAFITETGWSDKTLPQDVIAKYYQMTFKDIWDKDRDKIVAITPFLLNASGSPFDQFSFFKNGQPTKFLDEVVSLVKTKGEPALETVTQKIASAGTFKLTAEKFHPLEKRNSAPLSPFISMYFKTIFGLN